MNRCLLIIDRALAAEETIPPESSLVSVYGVTSWSSGDSKAAYPKMPNASKHSQTLHSWRPLQAAPDIASAYESCDPP